MQAMHFPAMHVDSGKLIVVDAVDGAGKNTVVGALCEELDRRNHVVIDLDLWQSEGGGRLIPAGDDHDLQPYDTLVISEPTHSGVGLAIREEIMKKKAYDAWSTAMAYALDRQVLYERTVLPFLRAKPGRTVIQVRGLMSSLCYQTIQAEDEKRPVTVDQLLELPGNRLELSRRPDLILLLMLSPETAQKRLAGRTGKVDGDKFGDPRFQARVSLRYRARDVLDPFERLGSNIVFVDAERLKEDVSRFCTDELLKLL